MSTAPPTTRIKPSNHNSQLLLDGDEAAPVEVGAKVGLAVAAGAGVFKAVGVFEAVGATAVCVGGTAVAEGGMGVVVAEGLAGIAGSKVIVLGTGVKVDVFGNRVVTTVGRGSGVPGTSVGAVVSAGAGVFVSCSFGMGVLEGTVCQAFNCPGTAQAAAPDASPKRTNPIETTTMIRWDDDILPPHGSGHVA